MTKELFVNIGQWEEFLGMEFKKINFPNGYGARIEKTYNDLYIVNTLCKGVMNFDVFFDEIPLMNAEEVEEFLNEISYL